MAKPGPVKPETPHMSPTEQGTSKATKIERRAENRFNRNKLKVQIKEIINHQYMNRNENVFHLKAN